MAHSQTFSDAKRPEPERVSGAGPRRGLAIPHEYLARLPLLYAEGARNVRLGRFVASALPLAGLLLLAGGMALLAGGGNSLRGDLAWSLLLLAGIAAMAVNYHREPAPVPDASCLETSAAGLRAILVYTGLAWGAGAFLALPADPPLAVALAFGLGPLLLVMPLPDEGGIAAFTAPAAGLIVTAGLFQHWTWGRVVSPVILAAGLAVILFSHLHGERGRLNPRQPSRRGRT